MPDRYMQIGAFSQHVGVSADVLRAWERRYGLPRPRRTAAGRRLYGPTDTRVVTAMRQSLAQGLPAAEAARIAVAAQDTERPAARTTEPGELLELKHQLADALT